MNTQCRIILMVMSFAGVLQSSLGANDEEYPSTYLVLAPATIRPGLTFTLNVQIRKASGPVTVTASINDAGTNNADHIRAEGDFSPDEVGTLDLQIPDTLPVPARQYELEVTGVGGGLRFNETQTLQFDVTHFAIFVQTDKAIYKPGQTVNYRIFAVYPGMHLYKGPFDVTVVDPAGNIIQLHTGLQNETYGVITQSMVMSSEPVLGDWEIKVVAERQEKIQKVTIDEYVLPKFEVDVILPPYITEEYSQLNIQISSKYTYGKPLKGSADVIIKFNYYEENIKRSLQLDGTANVAVSMDDLWRLYKSIYKWSDDFYEGSVIIVTAVVTEELTGLKQNSSATVSYYAKSIKIEALPISSPVIKPGLTYTAFLAVTHQDGSMLAKDERRESLTIAYRPDINSRSSEWVRDLYSIPESGVIEATYDVPLNTTGLSITAVYSIISTQELDSYQPGSYNSYHSPMESPSSTFMQIALETEKVSVGESVDMIITTTEIATKLTYVVISQGNIKLSGSVASYTRTTPVSFTVDSTMTPKAKVIVSFIRRDGEVVVDSVELNVDGSFQNQVAVSFDKETSEPGDDITFSVESSPNSLVGILAVDQSVLLLKSGNDVTQEQVIEELSTIDTRSTPNFGDIYYRRKRSIWYPGFSQGTSARNIIDNAGLLAFTDANIYGWSDYFWFESGGRFDYGPVFAEAAPAADDSFSNKRPAASDPAAGADQSQISVRKEFPETWLWSDYISDANGRVTVRTVVPDTITSWLGSAFAVSMSDGLGIGEMPAKTTVFKPFFVSLNLPYSVIRGETLVLQANVFNYFDEDVKATVTLKKSTKYETITMDKNGIEKMSSANMVEKVTVPSGSGVSVSFPMTLKKLGMVDIEVTAETKRAGDGVRRQLLVEPEGASYNIPENRLFNEETDTTFEEVFNIGLPPEDELVPGSVRVLLSLTGDIMGPTMGNLDSLLKMPYGCGEQNMMTFAPDVFVYEYLTETDQSNAAIKDKALRFMQSGYQRELTYKHDDGSFSAFGKSDPSGSSWLTAFVVKSFVRAVPFITIDPKVIEMAVMFITNHQNRDGQLREPGRIVDTIIKGGVNSGTTLTAYITIALAEVQSFTFPSKDTQGRLERAIRSAQGYLERQLSSIREDRYAMSMVTYALALTESEMLSDFREALDNLAVSEGGQTYWTLGEEEEENDWYRPYHGPPSSDIEITAYALLTYIKMGDIPGAARIAKWMTNQRSAFGGYGSTQDTVIGLQALTEFAVIFIEVDPEIDVSVTLSSDATYLYETTINTDNAIILQQVELPAQSGDVIVRGSGRGTCLMAFTVFYHSTQVHERKHFVYTISIEDIDNNHLEITACGRYKGEASQTSMCLMDIGIPSGFAADRDHLIELTNTHPLIQKFENEQQSVYLYFEEIPKDEMTCAIIRAVRSNNVAKVQPKYARLYDYYNPAEQVIVEYSSETLKGSTVCDVCPNCAGCSGGAKQPLVSLALLVATLIIAVFVGKV